MGLGFFRATLYVLQNSIMTALTFLGEKVISNFIYGIITMLVSLIALFIICYSLGFEEE